MESCTFLREYSDEERRRLDRLVAESVAQLPFTLAFPIARAAEQIAAGNYGRAMNHTLDFLEISVQYLSCLLFVRLQRHEADTPQADRALNRTVTKIDTKRPLSFGDWVNDIFTPLVRTAAAELPGDPLAASLAQHIVRRRGNVLLGDNREPSVVQIRNEYKGHSTTLSENIYRGVVYTLEPRIMLMLEAMRPLHALGFASCTGSDDEGRPLLADHKGAAEKAPAAAGITAERNHYYVTDPASGVTEDLFPLVFGSDEGYVYVFQSLKEEAVSYISSNENAVTFIDDCWNEPFDRLMQRTSPAFDIARELNWDQMRTMMAAESSRFLRRVYREKKYNRELFVDRRRLTSMLGEFNDSDRTLFPLLGEAGQGKTNQLCYWTERLMEQGEAVLVFASSDFASVTLDERLREIFAFSRRKDIRKLMESIHARAAENGAVVHVFFDAINECLAYRDAPDEEGPIALYEAIRSIFAGGDYPRFKVLFTCRSYTWKNLFHRCAARDAGIHFRSSTGDDEATAVRGFDDGELRQAYDIYRRLYQMTTPFGSLAGTARIRLKDPLVLKIACTNYLGSELPPTTSPYASIALFGKMLDDISRSYAGNMQRRIIEMLAAYILDSYEHRTPVDSIPSRKLREAYNDPQSPLHEMAAAVYKNDGITIAYGELLNKPERPVLRFVESVEGDGSGQIQFIYERFLEYVMALAFVGRERAAAGGAAIPARRFAEELHAAQTNVVFMGAMRNALIMDCMHAGDPATIITLARDFSDDYEVMLLVNETLNVLIRENYEAEIFETIGRLLSEQVPGGEALTAEFNAVTRKIEGNRADEGVIARHKELHRALLPVIRLRKLASVSTLNGLFLTDYFNEGLYTHDPFELLWRLMTDPVNEVGNDACLYAYYLSNKRRTLEYSPLHENLSERIVHEMYSIIKTTPLHRTLFVARYRRRSVVFLETATRITTLLIIDALLSGEKGSRERAGMLLGEIRSIFSYITGGFSLVRILMPFFQFVLRRQITFQSDYVNNAVEYQTFWDDAVVPYSAGEGKWCRRSVIEAMTFIDHYGRYRNGDSDGMLRQRTEAFARLRPAIMDAYRLGDSFSYFILERIMVVMGTSDWQNIRPVVHRVFSDEYRATEYFDYSQMSLLYVLYQVAVYSPAENAELLEIYGRESEEWTRKCRGLFRGRNSRKANTTGLYKRNVMNWYCVVYCTHTGDGRARSGDERCVPVFYRLINEALGNNDRELLFHLIENISELITDFGYIRTALDLLLYIMQRLDTQQKIDRLDAVELDRAGIYRRDTVQAIGNLLGTAKNYFPAQVDAFIKKEIVGLPFPGVSKYREEILNYNPSGESLSDLFTHKFGNFLMWSLLHEQTVDRFAVEAIDAAVDARNCFGWYDRVVRILFRHMFGVKL